MQSIQPIAPIVSALSASSLSEALGTMDNLENIPLDESGVPVFSGGDLETRASAKLRAFRRHLLREPLPTPVEEMVQYLAGRGRLEYDSAATLSAGLRGRCQFRPAVRIEIDKHVSGTRRRAVIAHELAHYWLHRDLTILRRDYVADTESDVFGEVPARRWMEWQAGRFTSALLMPSESIAAAVGEALREVRNLGPASQGPRLRMLNIARYVAGIYDVEPEDAFRRIGEVKRMAAAFAGAESR